MVIYKMLALSFYDIYGDNRLQVHAILRKGPQHLSDITYNQHNISTYIIDTNLQTLHEIPLE